MNVDDPTSSAGRPIDPRADADVHGAALDLSGIVARLRQSRERWRTSQERPCETSGRELPSRDALADILAGLRGALFPMRLGPPDLRQENEDYFVGHTLDTVLHALLAQVRLELGHQARSRGESTPALDERALDIVREFGAALPAIRELLDHRCPGGLSPRSGGAQRRRSAAAKRFAVEAGGQLKKGGARHPIVEDDVVIYAGATVLGRVAIGRGASIGGNVWLTHSVPAGSRVAQASLLDDHLVDSAGVGG